MKTKTPKLWLVNTSKYHPHEAFILCRTALESVEHGLLPGEVLKPIKVKLTNSSHAYCGRAYWTEWEHKPRTSLGHGMVSHAASSVEWRRILVRIGPPSRFPRMASYPKFKDMPEWELKTYREAMVTVAAHEMGHTLGYSGRKHGETNCEMCAWDALDYYRKHQVDIDAEIEAALAEVQQREMDAKKARDPEAKLAAKLAKAERGLKKWKRKLTAATNKVKKYTRLVRRLSKTEPVLTILRPQGIAEHEAEPLAATSDDYTDK